MTEATNIDDVIERLRAFVETPAWEGMIYVARSDRDALLDHIAALRRACRAGLVSQGAHDAYIAELTERAEKAERERDEAVADAGEARHHKAIAEHNEKAAIEAVNAMERERIEAEAGLWRVLPNTHTLSCELNGFAKPDPFEGPGETYSDAYRRVCCERDEAQQANLRWLMSGEYGDDLRAKVKRLREALTGMVNEKAEYMRINNLGDPEAQHSIKVARAALAAQTVPGNINMYGHFPVPKVRERIPEFPDAHDIPGEWK